MSITAPYRFVPLSKAIVLPDWEKHASHDVPFADGISGELHITLTAHTDLCIGGMQDKATPDAPGKVHFFRGPDGKPAIPGSSLKGMLRNVLEIAGFGQFKSVQDKSLGVRDITSANNFYFKAMGNNTKAGWLTFTQGSWSIQPCDVSRIRQADLIAICGIPQQEWIRLSKAEQRYAKIGTFKNISFKTETLQRGNIRTLAIPDASGADCGHIVVTGQPGGDYTKRNSKNKEFVFHATTNEAMLVPPEVMSGFRQIHDESDEWKFWMTRLQGGNLTPGIPVFYNTDTTGQIVSLGLSYMYKLPYKLSLHQAIANTKPLHLDGSCIDLAGLLFGHMDESGDSSLRGRVSIGTGSALDTVKTHWSKATVLNGPKPNYYPTYIRQAKNSKGKDWNQLMKPNAELSGWKRYPLKRLDILPPPDKASTAVQVQLECTPEQTQFCFTLRFHNLRAVELGALLWVITLPSPDGKPKRHNIGMGKPYGLGQVSLDVGHFDYRFNDPNFTSTKELDHHNLIEALMHEFQRFMDQQLNQSWIKSEPMKALLDYMSPNGIPSATLKYMELKAFNSNKADVKNADDFHISAGLQAVNDKNDYTADFNGSVDYAIKAHKDREVKADLDVRKQQSSNEQKILIELEEYLGKDGMPGKTALKHIESKLREAFDSYPNFSNEERTRLITLVKQANSIGNKLISKACKKIIPD